MRRFLYAAVAMLTVVYVAYVTWLYAHHLFYRRTVLEVPVRFEEGFSLTRQFSVGPAAKYWVGIKYNKVFRSTAINPTPPTEFTAEFDILSRGKVVAHGGTESFLNWRRPWSIGRDYVICFVAPFDPDAGKSYDLSLRITNALPSIIATEPEAMVFVDPHFDMGYALRKVWVICVGAAVVVFGLMCGVSVMRRRRQYKRKALGVAS